MTKERFSQETKSYMYDLIHEHARYDDLAEQYVMDINDLTKRQTERLAAYMMLHQPDMAGEATGPDNRKFDSMLMSLIKYMKNTENFPARLGFTHHWANGIKHYFIGEIEDLIEITLTVFNVNKLTKP